MEKYLSYGNTGENQNCSEHCYCLFIIEDVKFALKLIKNLRWSFPPPNPMQVQTPE